MFARKYWASLPCSGGSRSRYLSFLGLALILVLAACSFAPVPARPGAIAPATVEVTDVVGRSVSVTAPIQRMLLGEARLIYLISLLDREDPFKRVVGMPADLRTADLDTYNAYREKFPRVTQIPELGAISAGAFSVEKAIELKPELMVLSFDTYGPARESGLIDQLAKAGIPSVVIDFRQFPLENTVPSAHLMGRLLDRREAAQRFADYYTREVNKVYSRVDALKPPLPTSFILRAPGLLECCATFGRANLGLIAERAGGINLGSGRVPGWAGTLNPEQVLTSDPDLIVATGSNWTNSPGQQSDVRFVSLGYAARSEDARAQLIRLTEQPGWGNLKAVRSHRVHAIWHQFYNSPYHFVALQQFARWIHPDKFADLDPAATFREFHQQFLPIPYSGTFSVSIGE
ncbi:MAG: ABC transporter substrate-binding protein [Chloroflexota bacterium]